MKISSGKRKKVFRALAVIVWLLLLGSISYWLCLPDLDEVSRSLKAIREDPNLTIQQKFEKSREIFSKLTPTQGRQVFQNDSKKFHYEQNAEMQKFLKMSPEEQRAYLKKQADERKQHRPLGGFALHAHRDGSGPVVSKGGGGSVAVKGGGPGGGQFIFYGPGPGGPGGGPPNPSQIQKNMLDNLSPETRAGMAYQKGLLK